MISFRWWAIMISINQSHSEASGPVFSFAVADFWIFQLIHQLSISNTLIPEVLPSEPASFSVAQQVPRSVVESFLG